MHAGLIARLTLLLASANGTPILATHWLGRFWSRPLDGGRSWVDGRPVFGPSKTVRGLVLSIVVTSVVAAMIGPGWWIGARVGALSMLGDLCSSFGKRRLGLASSSRATGLDQVPESLLPLLGVWGPLSLSAADILIVIAVFFVGEILLSRVLYRMHIRDRPY